jgi:hypothetical protein
LSSQITETEYGEIEIVVNEFRTQDNGWAHDFSNGTSTTEVVALADGRAADRAQASGERAEVAANFEDPAAVA